MPIFEYECPECGIFEVIRKTHDLDKCPGCGAEVVPLMSAPGVFNLKGAGFYGVDYKKRESKEVKRGRPRKEEVVEPVKKVRGRPKKNP